MTDVLVIGAGPAGIACAYSLEKAGLSYVVVDQAREIASTWNSLYPSLRLNTTRFFSHLPEKKFPLHYGIFPTGKQYHRYLVNYVKERQFNIRLGVSVKRLTPEDGGWRVETSEGSAWYPAVISATGRFSTPIMPRLPGMDDFTGRIMHAHDYINKAAFAGQRVMVVGNGPSGIDIAVDVADVAARPVLLSQRTGVVLRPMYPLGLPKHAWMMIGEALPRFIGEPLVNFIKDIRYPARLLKGIKTPPPGLSSSAAGGTRGRALIDAVRAAKVTSVDAPSSFEREAVILTDGTRVEVDTVIMATGYRPALFDYVDLSGVPVNAHGWPVRVDEPGDVYWQGGREVRGAPGLYLVGVYYQGKGAMYNFNVEAAQAVAEIQACLEARLRTRAAAPSLPATS
ncbi:MAG: NAD(P)/FAD-dependent oxidoreductase [Anaerolineae bacterium]